MINIPSRLFLGDGCDHLRIGGNTLVVGSSSYVFKDIFNSIDYSTNFNVRQSMTGGNNDQNTVDDDYLYGVITY